MSDATRKNKINRTLKKTLSYSIGVVFFALALLIFCLKIYLASPYSAEQLSRLLSSYLSQPVKIFAVHTSGATLYLKGVQIANPPGFPAGNLARVDSL
ncbi:MAG TPA: hypothetical protein VGJ93_02705, partial [Desulfuromonadaceae bacterium]